MKILLILFAFGYNPKSFAIVFLLLLLLVGIFGRTGHRFLIMFLQIATQDACDQYQAFFIGQTEKLQWQIFH